MKESCIECKRILQPGRTKHYNADAYCIPCYRLVVDILAIKEEQDLDCLNDFM